MHLCIRGSCSIQMPGMYALQLPDGMCPSESMYMYVWAVALPFLFEKAERYLMIDPLYRLDLDCLL